MTTWKFTEGSVGYKTWIRSYRQTIETPFREAPTLCAYMEEPRLYEDGRVEVNRNLPVVSFSMDQLTPEQSLLAQKIQESMTALIGEVITRPPTPPPTEEAPLG